MDSRTEDDIGTPDAARPLGPQKRYHRMLQALCALAVVIAALAGGAYLKAREAEAIAAANDKLSAVADLKLRQIAGWRQERLADARFFSQARFAANDIRRFLDHPSIQNRANVVQWLNLLKGGDRYYAVLILDSEMACRLSIPDHAELPANSEQDLLTTALKMRSPVLGDLHRDKANASIHIDIAAPIFKNANPSSGNPIAIVLLQMDARQFLFPLVQSWPTPSRTGETYLVCRKGDRVLYLSNLHDAPDAALTLRFPIDSQDLDSARVVRGETQPFQGEDFHGIPVVVVGRMVPDTDWAMVAEMHQRELYGPLQQQILAEALVLGGLLTIGVLTVTLIWRRRNAQFLERAKREWERTFDSVPDLIAIFDNEHRIRRMNRALAERLGLSADQCIGRVCYECVHGADEPVVACPHMTSVADGHEHTAEMYDERLGGHFMVSTCPLFDEAGQMIGSVHVSRDVSALKQAESDLRKANAELESRVAARTSDLAKTVDRLEAETQERAQAQEALFLANQNLRSLTLQLTRAEAQERLRLSQVLHDHLQQLIVAASLNVHFVEDHLFDPNDRKLLADTAAALSEAVEECRSLAVEMAPPVLKRGLVAALPWLAEWMQRRHGLAVRIQMDPDAEPNDADVVSLLFQSVREALFNVVKHAGVREALVLATRPDPDSLRVEIIDKGSGFDPRIQETSSASAGQSGLGLFSIRDRLRLLGGRVEVQSAPGCGTQIILNVPLSSAPMNK